MAVVKREGVDAARRERKQKALGVWERHPSVKRFLQDWFPDKWNRIANCAFFDRQYVAMDGSLRLKLLPRTCKEIPFCISCTQVENHRRTKRMMDKLAKCSPPKPAEDDPETKETVTQRPRFQFIRLIVTGPVVHMEDGSREGWGLAAADDPKGLSQFVFRALTELYGEGIGVTMSYQDFGRLGPAKQHPHLDITINGWGIKENFVWRLGRYELRGKGQRTFRDALVNHAQAFQLGIENVRFDLSGPHTGTGNLYKSTKYMMREMWDFRQIDYSRSEQKVWWLSDKSNERTLVGPPEDFIEYMEEYQRRVGEWGNYQAPRLHRTFGHLSKKACRKASATIGGVPIPHGKECPCSKCSEWVEIDLDRDPGFENLLTFE